MNLRTFKLISILSLIFSVLFIPGCTNQKNTENIDISRNIALRDNIYQQILNNDDLLNGFMDRMMGNPQAMDQMLSNVRMMQFIFNQDNLKYMMHKQESNVYGIMENIMDVIKSDTLMVSQWQSIMRNNPDMQQMMKMHR